MVESGLRDEKSEFKIVNKFDKWLDMRKVKERLLSLKQDIYLPGGKIISYTCIKCVTTTR